MIFVVNTVKDTTVTCGHPGFTRAKGPLSVTKMRRMSEKKK